MNIVSMGALIRVRSLDESIAFYEDILGLVVFARDESAAELQDPHGRTFLALRARSSLVSHGQSSSGPRVPALIRY